MTEETVTKINNDLVDKIKKMCEEIYPNLDSIQIFATRHVSNEFGTSNIVFGLGNFYARYGQIIQWLKDQDLQIGEEEQ